MRTYIRQLARTNFNAKALISRPANVEEETYFNEDEYEVQGYKSVEEEDEVDFDHH